MVNLIVYNPTGLFYPSPLRKLKIQRNFKKAEGITVTQRHEFGQDIEGACGQLSVKK